MSKNNKIIQSSLVSGVLSEDAIGRLDYPKYYNGCAEATNMFVQPVGGMDKRAGFEQLATLPSDYRMFEFLFNTNDKYVVLIGEMSIKIWDIMNPTANTFIDVTNLAQLYTLQQAKELDFVQSGDTMILTHGDIQPQKLVRYRYDSGVIEWKLEVITLTNIPQFNWDTNKHDAGASRVLKSKAGNNDILNLRDDILDAISLGEGVTPRVPSKDIDVSVTTVGGTTTTTTNIKERGEFRYPSGYDLSHDPEPTDTGTRWGTRLTIIEEGGSVSNSSSMVWDELLSDTIQKAIRSRITMKSTDYSSLSAEQLTLLIGSDFTPEINAEITKVLGTWDAPTKNIHDVWGIDSNGINHGYPKYCTFYQNRLFFAGSPAKPLTVWGSVLNDYFNFDISEADADYAIADTINSNTLNHITGIYPSNVLQLYTSGSEYTNASAPITPTDSAWTFQTGMGSKANVALDSLDGTTIFIDRSGAIRDFVYNFQSDNYISKNLALLARQIIKTPDQLVIIRSSQIDLSKLVYFRNSDGSLAVLNIDKNESILAWTDWNTNGEIVEIVGVDQSLFVLVKKNGVYSFETLNRREYTYNTVYNQDNSVYLDSYTERIGIVADPLCANTVGGDKGTDFAMNGRWGTACSMFVNPALIHDTDITGLEFYEGTDVTVMLDKFHMGTYKVTAGKITVPRTFIKAQIGYPFTGRIKTLPLSSSTYGGQMDYNRIVKIVANFNRSTAVTIDNQYITDRDFGTYTFGSAPKELSGIREVYTLGWDRFIQFEVKSEYPYRMNLLSFTSYLDSNSAV